MLALAGRTDTINWLLMFHVIAAVLLVAATLAVSIAGLVALRAAAADRATFFRQTAFQLNLYVVLPAFVAVILLGDALANEEGLDKNSPDWLDAGWTVTFLAGIVGGIVLSGLQYWALRRTRAGAHRTWQAQTASYVAPIVLAALFVVLFLMAAKPGSGIEAPA